MGTEVIVDHIWNVAPEGYRGVADSQFLRKRVVEAPQEEISDKPPTVCGVEK
ncbi:hypothetical protein [Halolamina sp. C58]|uniref:hypothetical protein n=1 Tax=Halolamina sp. C58 TaxID=3421640 RepID=UPI003EBD8B6C